MRYSMEPVTYKTFGACINVQRQLGPYSREIDCQRALEIELPKQGLEFIREAEIPIIYDGVEITRRRADFVIWDSTHTILLETKAIKVIRPEDVEQCLLYLRNGNFRVCLLANFGQVPLGKQRFVYTPTGPALYGPHR